MREEWGGVITPFAKLGERRTEGGKGLDSYTQRISVVAGGSAVGTVGKAAVEDITWAGVSCSQRSLSRGQPPASSHPSLGAEFLRRSPA